jgi:hypothetical protein
MRKRRVENQNTNSFNMSVTFSSIRSNSFDLGQISSPPTSIILMNMVSWNIRDLNAKIKQGFLKERIKKEQPDILLL